MLLLLLFAGSCKGQPSPIEEPLTATLVKTNTAAMHEIPYRKIYCTLQDQQGNIWFGTTGEGVYCCNALSLQKGQPMFSHFTKFNGLLSNTVSAIIQDKAGNIWFGTDHGACCYNGKTFANLPIPGTNAVNFSPLLGPYLSPNAPRVQNFSPRSIAVFNMLQDTDGNIWFATDGGAFRYDGNKITHFLSNKDNMANGGAPNYIRCISQDKHGNIWFDSYQLSAKKMNDPCITNSCLHNVETAEGKAAHNKEIAGCFINFNTKEALGNYSVNCMLQDKKGRTWFGTYQGGAFVYDGKSFKKLPLGSAGKRLNVENIFEDKSGNIWMGTWDENGNDGDGAYQYDGQNITHFTVKDGLANNVISAIEQDSQGNIWFGTDGGGISCYDGQSFKNFTIKDGISNNHITCAIKDKTGRLWFGSWNIGLCCYYEKRFLNFTGQ